MEKKLCQNYLQTSPGNIIPIVQMIMNYRSMDYMIMCCANLDVCSVLKSYDRKDMNMFHVLFFSLESSFGKYRQ